MSSRYWRHRDWHKTCRVPANHIETRYASLVHWGWAKRSGLCGRPKSRSVHLDSGGRYTHLVLTRHCHDYRRGPYLPRDLVTGTTRDASVRRFALRFP